jgi:hypothetical protein
MTGADFRRHAKIAAMPPAALMRTGAPPRAEGAGAGVVDRSKLMKLLMLFEKATFE